PTEGLAEQHDGQCATVQLLTLCFRDGLKKRSQVLSPVQRAILRCRRPWRWHRERNRAASRQLHGPVGTIRRDSRPRLVDRVVAHRSAREVGPWESISHRENAQLHTRLAVEHPQPTYG